MHAVSRATTAIAALALFALVQAAPAAQDERSIAIDVILLVDKSLSMDVAIEDVKKYLAASVIGPVILPGDRLVIELFYGKTETLFSGTVESEDAKHRVVEDLSKVRADGRFTDIGAALDRIDAILADLGEPDRPKLVMLFTDERQEAPPGTKYFSPDYKAVHPYLTWIDRVDHGSFRAIVVGAGIDARIDESSEKVLTFLSAPPQDRAAAADGGKVDLQGATESLAEAAAKRQRDIDTALFVAAGVSLLLLLVLATVAILRAAKARRDRKRIAAADDDSATA